MISCFAGSEVRMGSIWDVSSELTVILEGSSFFISR